MPSVKPSSIKLGRAIPAPKRFEPVETWTEGGALYRLDPHRGICKRSPLTPSSPLSTMYYLVEPGGATSATRSSHPVVVAPRRRKRDSGQPGVAPSPSPSPKKSRPPSASHLARIHRLFLRLRPRRRFATFTLGATAIVAALVVVYPYTPAVQYQLFRASSTGSPQAVQRVVADREIDGNRVIIPKIGVDTPIVEGSSLDVLKTEEGVWHQTGDISGGNFVLAGHRFKYLPPNTSTLYNLDKLAAGDTIAVDWEGRRTIYQVTKLMTVGANDTSILNSDFGQRLTIYTCTDTRQTQRTVAIAQVAANP